MKTLLTDNYFKKWAQFCVIIWSKIRFNKVQRPAVNQLAGYTQIPVRLRVIDKILFIENMIERFSLRFYQQTADTLFDANINKKNRSSLFPPDVEVDPTQNVSAFQLAAIKRRI